MGIGAYFLGLREAKVTHNAQTVAISKAPVVTTVPTPSGPYQYVIPKIEKKREYQIFMLGDSMTHALGPHGGTFYEYINALYKKDNHGILIDNYAQPSTSILTVNNAMNRQQKYWDVDLAPLMSRKFDIILIESFGYNPLSQFPRAEGLKKQTELLDQTVRDLKEKHPNAAIIFVATIAPSKLIFARKVDPGKTTAGRASEVDERSAFILNHIAYAKAHNIPLVNVYEKSMKPDGDGNTEYINPDDDIHPSAVGVNFIGHELADFIYASNILPK